ncbi:cytochrome P450 [Cucurbitaria berberidis CBS 394.84]|uniref:Cytochrome P450 n=1 Tax=Cucurbitaria berberidis CBS 394.84 TaxID=1168544 RepID=A0A9P4GRY5_9PLEO|nr:cytochrome P450 [Cucurbitaria berberidis CBS 394.84]KAF1850255.1 cytochrome P450 [Cucurbitaria berberidis CBS 394.84]
MHPSLVVGFAVAIIAYLALQFLLHGTQSKREPCILETTVPFFDSAIGILRHRANYLSNLRSKYRMSIYTLRMPFQRLYVVHAPNLIQTIQSKANAATFIPNLLDFGMLFSGLNEQSQRTLRDAFGVQGNGFTMSVHKYLLSGPSLKAATRAAVDRLSASVPNHFEDDRQGGLLELVRHELTLALTGAIYGPENPYDDPDVEASWRDFLPGISHLLYSPCPSVTARKALNARTRVIHAFRKYFQTGGHLQAFPMIAEMYETNKSHGLALDEAAKMEMATSLAMLSSGAVTTFWLLFHILSDPDVMMATREELHAVAKLESTSDNSVPRTKVLDLSGIKGKCPTLVAMLNETLRYHSTVINIKQVQHDTTLGDQYLLKKNGIVMIPGESVHHNVDIWGPSADTFDHHRFLSPDSKKKLSTTSAFRPFGAGATMCPGRHFSTSVILSLVAMVVLQYEVLPLQGQWIAPTKRNADLWNAMPKPDWDIDVRLSKMRVEENPVEWRFAWGEDAVKNLF